MEIHAVKNSNVVDNFKMCCVVVIIPRYWYLVLHIKFNLNTMAEIYMFLLK